MQWAIYDAKGKIKFETCFDLACLDMLIIYTPVLLLQASHDRLGFGKPFSKDGQTY